METRNIDPKYIVKVKGRDFVKYDGLITMAHESGIQSLNAKFLHVSSELATATATVMLADGRTFTECGDATPNNVASHVAPHFARVALTRAKSRALRDALNIHMVSTAEIGDISDAEGGDYGHAETGEEASAKQIGFICSLLKDRGVKDGDKKDLIREAMGEPVLKSAASQWIEHIKERDMLPTVLFTPYVKMLFTKSSVSRAGFVAWMNEHFSTANTDKITDKSSQLKIINWLSSASPSGASPSGESAAPAFQLEPDDIPDQYKPGPAIDPAPASADDWVFVVRELSEGSQMSGTEVMNFLLAKYAKNGETDLTQLPNAAYLAAKELYPGDISQELDAVAGE